MGKIKNKGGNNNPNTNNQNQNNNQQNNNNNPNNNNNNTNNNNITFDYYNYKNEEKENEKKEGGEYQNIVLKINIHCDGCTKRIRKAILSFPGVIGVEFEGESKVKVLGKKNVDAVKLREKVEKKILKKVELISPQPPKKDDQKKDNKTDGDDKPKELALTTVVLKIPYHCYGCGERTHKAISSYKGVCEVKIDKEKDLVTVTGKIEPKKLVDDLKIKLKKSVEIAPEKKDKDKNDQKKEGGGNKEQKSGAPGDKTFVLDYYGYGYGPGYGWTGDGYGSGFACGPGSVVGMFQTPQLFSDENPNACSIM